MDDLALQYMLLDDEASVLQDEEDMQMIAGLLIAEAEAARSIPKDQNFDDLEPLKSLPARSTEKPRECRLAAKSRY
jgi:hypothetical protein